MNRSFSQFKATREEGAYIRCVCVCVGGGWGGGGGGGGEGLYPDRLITGRDFLLPD